MRLYFPVDLTGNLIMIEKLVLGEIWTGDPPIFNPDALTSAPPWQATDHQEHNSKKKHPLGTNTVCWAVSDPWWRAIEKIVYLLL